MSYKNPQILTIDQPIGLDAVIQSIQTELMVLTWLDKSFGRAWEFTETAPDGRQIKVPKCYLGDGEYINVLPNDFLKAQSFIQVISEERWVDFEKYALAHKERDLAVVFWFNLKSIDSSKKHIFTEELKKEVSGVLASNAYIKSINTYVDEKAEEVFKGFIDSGAGTISTTDDDKNQYLMHPYSGFRFELTAGYTEPC